MARMAAIDGLPSRTICTVLGSSQVDCSAEALPSALIEDTSLYDTRHAFRSALNAAPRIAPHGGVCMSCFSR